jgi:hypothetical protein
MTGKTGGLIVAMAAIGPLAALAAMAQTSPAPQAPESPSVQRCVIAGRNFPPERGMSTITVENVGYEDTSVPKLLGRASVIEPRRSCVGAGGDGQATGGLQASVRVATAIRRKIKHPGSVAVSVSVLEKLRDADRIHIALLRDRSTRLE